MNTKLCSKCRQIKTLNLFHVDKNKKDNLSSSCKECKRKVVNSYAVEHRDAKRRYDRQLRVDCPEIKVYGHIKERCENPNCKAYKWYGAKDIKCLITKYEIKKLWLRDKAFKMTKPSIDRIDSKDNYIYANCRFIEQSENSKRVDRTNLSTQVIQYDLNNNFIKFFNSISEASRELNINRSSIHKCINNEWKTTHKFIFKKLTNNTTTIEVI